VRQIKGLFLVLVLVLAACAESPTPGPSPMAPAATATAVEPEATGKAPVVQTTATGAPLAAEPTPRPALATTVPSSPESPWPCFLRDLDFGIPAGNSYNPRALAIHAGLGRLYARTAVRGPDYSDIGQVTMLDLASGQVLATAEVGAAGYDEVPLLVDPIRDRVCTLDLDNSAALVLDADTLERIATLDGVAQLALDAEGGRLYVAGLGKLRALDAETYESLGESPPLSSYQFEALAVDPTAGRLYLVYRSGDGHALDVLDTASLEVLATAPLPGKPDALLADPKRSRLYLTLNDGANDLFLTFSDDGQVSEQETLGDWSRRTRLALDPAGDRLFLGRDAYGDYGISVLDLGSGQEVGDVPLRLAPNALAWDGKSGRLFVSYTYANQIAVVDVQAGRTGIFPTALNLVDLAVDPQRGHLYVTDSAGRLHVLDSESDEPLALLPAEGYLAVDSPHGRLYTGGGGADRVRVFDADSLAQTAEIQTKALPVADAHSGGLYLVKSGVYIASLETLTITGVLSDTLPEYPGYSPNPAAVDAVVDPGSGRLFAIINNGVPGSNNGNYLYVYEPETYQKVLTDTERSPVYVDVDPNTGRAYVSRTHMSGRSTSLLEDGREYIARLDAVFGPLRVDPALGRVYLTVTDESEGHLLILDAETLDVLGSLPIAPGFSLRALDPWRDLLYLASEGGHVQVWSALGGALPGPVEPAPAELPLDQVRQLFRSPGDDTLFAGSLYRSDDGGETWLNIGAGLPGRGVWQVVVSPNFGSTSLTTGAQDQTLFAVLTSTDSGLGIWKTTDGGRTWRMANRGLSDLAAGSLAISPDFAQDGTLFATTRRQGLFRSTDTLAGTGGGDSWQRLTDRYLPDKGYTQPPGLVVVSPTYAQDHTLFVAHEGLRRSTDGGDTWTTVYPGSPGALVLSPAFASDGMAYAWLNDAGLLQTTDGGETWQAAGAGLILPDSGSVRLLLPPDYADSGMLYLVFQPVASSDAPIQYFRTSGAATWERLENEQLSASTPVELSADGTAFVALDSSGRLARWPLAALDWQPVSLPPIADISVSRLVISPDFAQDQALLAVSAGAGILRSADGGLTWTDSGFPIRTYFGDDLDPVFAPGGTVYVGTALGLYRSVAGGPWELADDDLPWGISMSSPAILPDGALYLLAGRPDPGGGQRIYLSVDGQTWTQPLPDLPVATPLAGLLVSPALARDRTAFIALPSSTPLRSIGGGAWEEFGPPGAETLSVLEVSPAFDRDHLLLARLSDNSLWRSTNSGDKWTQISGPWGDEAPMGVSIGAGYVLHAATFSPDFGQDGVLLVRAGNSLYRSTDQGSTWKKALDLGANLVQVVFSPGYADDGTIYLLQGRTLYRSTRRGQKWEALPPAPWDESTEIKLRLSPTFPEDGGLLAWTQSGLVYLSADGGQSWRAASDGLPAGSLRDVQVSPDYAADQLLFLVPYDRGLYKHVGDGPWLPVADSQPPSTPEPEATPAPQPQPLPTPGPPPSPAPTSTPPTCAIEADRFRAVWQQASDQLGCPQEAAEPVLLVEQAFESGSMIWDSLTVQIYVLQRRGGLWQAFDDTFQEGVDPDSDPSLVPPAGLEQPVRGFGKVWRDQLGGPQGMIGWALEEERPVDGWRQRFERGLLVWTDATPAGSAAAGTAYLLYDDGTWQALPAPSP
jgi:DNA-binding beta-propeller fold protein YncE/photosystem II stability/assembly factor-like uncharacterized protein